MGLHKPFDRSFYVIGGAVKKNGGSLNLVKGQLAAVDGATTTKDGAKVLGTFAGIPKKHKFLELRLGIDERKPNRSYSNKPMASMPFSLNEVVDLKVSAPKRTEQLLDEVILGYNGKDAATSFNLGLGETYKRITLELEGDAISYLGGGTSKEVISINFEVPRCEVFNDCVDCDPCDAVDCKAWTLNVIETLKNHQLVGGTLVEELVDITPVFECDTPATAVEIAYDFYCLELCDTGDAEALALVQAQYDTPVKRIERNGVNSKYQVLLPNADGAPVALNQTLASILKGCEACPTGYTEVPGGNIYAIAIEDDGADLTAVIQALPNAVAATALKADGQDAGLGFYTVVLTAELTDAEITTFLTAGAPNNTATFNNLGEVSAICENPTVTTVAWEACGSCNVIEECYLIDLPDSECGDSRLAELQKGYKDLVITEVAGSEAGCQRTYKATTISNLVCDECDDIFKDFYVTEAPEAYDVYNWYFDPANETAGATDNCKCGIRVKSKPFVLKAGECFRDRINFVEDSVRVRISGGYPEEIREGIGKTPKDLFAVTRISKFEPRTHLGGNLQSFEENDRYYFTGGVAGDNLQRLLRGQESSIQDQCEQYVDYALTINHTSHSQGFAGNLREDIIYHFFVPVGRHADTEALLNSLASAAGVETVKAFGK